MEKWQKVNTILLVCILLLTGYLAFRLSGPQNGRFQPYTDNVNLAFDTATGRRCRTLKTSNWFEENAPQGTPTPPPYCEDLR